MTLMNFDEVHLLAFDTKLKSMDTKQMQNWAGGLTQLARKDWLSIEQVNNAVMRCPGN